MRIPTQFSPPKREFGEGLLSHSIRCSKAKKEFEEMHIRFTGQTRDEKLKSFVPNDELK